MHNPTQLTHGPSHREGVDGSSPSEGFTKSLQTSTSWCEARGRGCGSTSTERPPPSRNCGLGDRKQAGEVAAASTQRPPRTHANEKEHAPDAPIAHCRAQEEQDPPLRDLQFDQLRSP